LMTFPSSSPLFSSSFGNHQEDRNSISLPSSCWFRSFLLRKRKSPQNSFSSFFFATVFSDGSLLALCHQRETDQSFPLMPIDLIRHSWTGR
jgi:hypothetical protein